MAAEDRTRAALVANEAAAAMWWERLSREELEADGRYQYWRAVNDELDRLEEMDREMAERLGA